MIIIGDVHGKLNEYHKIIKQNSNEQSIQLGDFGFKKQHDWFLNNINSDLNKICFGNHDYIPYLNKPHSLNNYSVFNNVMTIRGANSIDKHLRIEGRDWFSNEEMNYSEWNDCIDYYLKVQPEIVVSHDCPSEIQKYLFGYNDSTITNQGMQSMFEFHKPKIWLFGHYHKSINEVIDGVRFICLNEMEVYKL